MNLTLRYALPSDAELIADISRQTFYDTFAADNSPEDMDKFLKEQFTRGRLMLEVGAPENTFLLAYADGRVAGYAKLRDAGKPAALNGSAALEIARLYALTGFLGKGVGAVLMKACLDVARAKEKETVWLGVWEKNRRALEFYTRWGFAVFGEWDFLLGNDRQRDLLMKMQLNER